MQWLEGANDSKFDTLCVQRHPQLVSFLGHVCTQLFSTGSNEIRVRLDMKPYHSYPGSSEFWSDALIEPLAEDQQFKV